MSVAARARANATTQVLLHAYAARSCPVKTQNAYDPSLADWIPGSGGSVSGAAEDRAIELFDGGLAWEAAVLDHWSQVPGVVDVRAVADPAQRRAAGWSAVRAGAPVVIGWELPVDAAGHRVGRPDALVRGSDTLDGRPGYHPVEVKWHKIVERVRPVREDRPPRTVRTTGLAAPGPAHQQVLEGHDLRVGRREGDFLQLAHYQRMLTAAGIAAGGGASGGALAAVIGTDDREHPFLAWIDLGEPLVRTFSRTEESGWRLRSLLERYDHEQEFRVDIAARALAQDQPVPPPLLVAPVKNDECDRCQWWEHCRPQLDADDVSLRIDKGPLDAREILALRRLGVRTLTDLAGADLDELGPTYLPEVTHRAGAENRLRVAGRRARMLLADRGFERETSGPIEVPAAALEIDFDVESAAGGRIYLWGFLVDDGQGPPVTRQFSRFSDLGETAELELAVEALRWLRATVEAAPDAHVYHYSGYEVAIIAGLAARSTDPVFDWVTAWAGSGFVDLLTVVKEHFFGAAGLGLKAIAAEAGFDWRDDDPGGLNSQIWFAESVHAGDPATRAAARQRVLEYNEDDVIATHQLRGWLRGHSAAD